MLAEPLPWILGAASLAMLVMVLGWWLWWRRRPRSTPLPAEWNLTARPVFSSDERRVYRQLREALPHHIVLSKLPLVRFCQPTDPQETRYWYELLGSAHVTFAVCSPNGRVLAAIDLETERSPSRRLQQIKQSMLAACRVRYLRCPADHLPSVPELQLLVPQPGGAPRGPHAAPPAPAPAPATGRRSGARDALWQDSGFFQDSFFGSETRAEGSVFGSLPGAFGPPASSGREAGIPGFGGTIGTAFGRFDASPMARPDAPPEPPGGEDDGEPPYRRRGGEPPFAARM